MRKKGMKAKIVAYLLIFTMMICIIPFIANSVEYAPESDFEFDASTGTITNYIGPGGDVSIPPKIGGVDVIKIGDYSFYGCSNLTSVIIPDSVEIIEDAAFALLESITSVIIGNSVEIIGGCAFEGTSIKSIIIPDSVITIGGSAFRNCILLESIIIPDRVTTIEDHAFADCESLASVTIGNSVETIGEYAFAGNTSLESIVIPNSVVTIGDYAFLWCVSLRSVTFKGDAPTNFGTDVFMNVVPLDEFKIYYYEGTNGWTTPTWNDYPTQMLPAPKSGICGDFDGDGEVTAADATIILRYIIGLENELRCPCCDD